MSYSNARSLMQERDRDSTALNMTEGIFVAFYFRQSPQSATQTAPLCSMGAFFNDKRDNKPFGKISMKIACNKPQNVI